MYNTFSLRFTSVDQLAIHLTFVLPGFQCEMLTLISLESEEYFTIGKDRLIFYICVC
jgi:hypothetical protein